MATKTTKVTLNSNIILGAGTVPVKFDIVINQRVWDVKGFMEIRTGEFTPELVGVFSVQQFAADVADMPLSDFVELLQDMVTKNIKR